MSDGWVATQCSRPAEDRQVAVLALARGAAACPARACCRASSRPGSSVQRVRWSRFPPTVARLRSWPDAPAAAPTRARGSARGRSGSAASVAVRDRGADPQAAVVGLLDPVVGQPAYVDEHVRRLDAEPHQVDEVRAAAEELRARLAGDGCDRVRGVRGLERSGTASPARVEDRRDDVGVGAAAADVAAHPLADLASSARARRAEVGRDGARPARRRARAASRRRAELPRRAVAALERVVLDECALERVQRRRPGEALDGDDLGAAVRDREREAARSRAARRSGPCTRRTGRGRSPSSRRSARAARAAGRAATCACRGGACARPR